MLKVKYRSQFKKDYKRALKRGLDPEALRIVLDKLINNETLDAKYRDHQLVDSRKYKNFRECHIQPDWLLIYYSDQENLILTLVRTGTHSDLF